MKKILLVVTTLVLMLGCETGVRNKSQKIVEVPSGIVDKDTEQRAEYYSKTSNSSVTHHIPRIYSKSAQPGYYLQYAVFEKYRPTKSFLAPLSRSRFPYIVLNKSSKDYVLIGPYKSYNQAHAQIHAVKTYLHKQTFVVQVLRP